jgi:ABC-type spermidine/putrescine transport system permease subunit I
MPMQIYEQIFELGYWQFGAALGAILFGMGLLVIILYHQFSQRQVGGLL